MAERPLPAAVGFSSHSGWVAVVCLGGSANAPVVIERTRVLLTSAPLPREPYHEAKRREPELAGKIVTAAAEEARALAAEAITGLANSVGAQGYELIASGIVLSGTRPGFTLSQALSTHAAMHGAEGWLFREALIDASRKCGLRTTGVGERDLLGRAASAFVTSEDSVSALVQRLGRGLGSPWGKDQKAAATAALVALSLSSL
ncbi:MAG TPA: hypothetical protein VGR43_03160 [Dehalococcoidia bacterium]|jgi:hypothetical protein|nr:hypothetical protein [Dehalococcoidia bacterium]